MAKKFLLIDDDADDRLLFCEALEEIMPDIICYSVSDSAKAFSELENKKIELPNLIFLDVNMPGESGWDCFMKLKEHEQLKDVPVIMYSTSSQQADINKAKYYGALWFFTKPYSYKALKERLETVVTHLNNNSLDSITLNSQWFTISSSPN